MKNRPLVGVVGEVPLFFQGMKDLGTLPQPEEYEGTNQEPADAVAWASVSHDGRIISRPAGPIRSFDRHRYLRQLRNEIQGRDEGFCQQKWNLWANLTGKTGRELRRQTLSQQLGSRTDMVDQFGTVPELRGFDVRGLWARANVDDAAELNQFLGLTGSSSVREDLRGAYLQVGYNLLNEFHETASLMPFFRYETLSTQDSVPAGFFGDPARDRDFFTLGLEFKPIRNIVLKPDFQWLRNEAESGVNQFNLSLGYAF